MKRKAISLAIAATLFAGPLLAAEPKAGGDIVVTYQNDVATLDPAIGYDWQNWSMTVSYTHLKVSFASIPSGRRST